MGSNGDNVDTEKNFNAVIDENESSISLIDRYSAYHYALSFAGSEDRSFNYSSKVKVYTNK